MALPEAGVQLVAAGLSAFESGMGRADRAVADFGRSGAQAGSAFDKGFGDVVTGALRQVGALGVEALLKAGQAVAGFVTDSIGLAGDFQSGMLEFQSVAGKDVDTSGLEEFHDLFLQLGKDLPVSTSDVQKAAIEMVKGGIDPATVAAGALRQNIQFAAAAMDGDLVKAAEISSKIMGGWAGVGATAAEKAEFLTHATDLLAKAANASSTDVEGLSQGIFNAQGIARTAGVSFDDLTTTLAALAPRFASSSEAGNSLKNMIVRLQPTTDPAIQAMTSLGLYTEEAGSAFYDAQGNFVGFQQASELLKNSLVGLTKEQQAATLQQIFGNDAMGSAAALAELGAAGYQEMADSLANANGVMDAAALKQQGFNTSLDNAKGSVEALQITLGEKLLPILGQVLDDYIAPAINSFTEWAAAIFAAEDPLQQIISDIDSMLPGFQSFVDTAQKVAAFIGDNLNPILFGLATAITVAVIPALVSATAAFLAAAAPVVALVAAGALLYKAWESDFLGIKTTLTAVWNDTLLPAFKDMQAWLAEKIPPAIKTLSRFWTDTLQPALAEVWGFLQDKVFPVLSDLVDIYIAAAIIEVKALAAIWTNVLQPALKVVWDFITGAVIPIFAKLFDVEFAIAMKAGEALAGLWQKVISPALKAVGDFITGTVIPAFKGIGDYLSATFGPTLEKVGKWLDDVTGGFGGVTGAVKAVVDWIGNLAESISKLKLPDWLTPGSPTPWEIALRGIGNALSTSVAPGLNAMRLGIIETGEQIADTFESTDLVDVLESLGEDIMGGFIDGIKNAWRGVEEIINSTADTVEGAFREAFDASSPAQRMVPIGQSITQGIVEGLIQGWPALLDQVGSISDDLIGQMEGIGEAMQNAIADGFGATASIDRQMAKNLAAIGEIKDAFTQQVVAQDLAALQQKAQELFTDPKTQADYFKMVSAHEFETLRLRQQIAEASTDAEKERLNQQLILISRAHDAELDQFYTRQQGQRNPMLDIADQVNAVMLALSKINLTDDQIKIVDLLSGVWSRLITPPASPSQMPVSTPTTNTNNQTYNMPIYTNQNPTVLQDSMFMARAIMT